MELTVWCRNRQTGINMVIGSMKEQTDKAVGGTGGWGAL